MVILMFMCDHLSTHKSIKLMVLLSVLVMRNKIHLIDKLFYNIST